MTTRIVLVGATGRTGNAVAHGLASDDSVELVGCVAPSLGGDGEPTRAIPAGVGAASSLDQAAGSFLSSTDNIVVVDISSATGAPATFDWCVANGVNLVLGTTGIAEGDLAAAGERFAAADLRLLYCPNFSLGAVLMMQFAEQAARLLHDVEITETHHETKLDAPSGTARRTAELVAAAGGHAASGTTSDRARGEIIAGVPVHSLRLPGALAHQTVTFGAPGELLSVRHDALDRACYAAGVALAARKVASLPAGLTVGLENILE